MADDGMHDAEARKNDLIVAAGAEESAMGTDPIAQGDMELRDPPKLSKATTWLDKPSEKIRQFVYEIYSYEHYRDLAKRAKALIEAQLEIVMDQNGDKVQAKVTCRAKELESLEEKLKMREVENGRPYKDAADIRNDVKDLAGVRIILYTPTQAQHDGVKQMVLNIWGSSVIEKKHDGSDSSAESKEEQVNAQKRRGYVRKHFGYQAIHYRAPMKKDQALKNVYKYKDYDWVEIQVVSALGHAWAEAGHDVHYKSYAFGPPTEREERILDALSGLVSTGDLLLEDFRGLVNERTYAKWKMQEEFAIFFRQTDILRKPRDEYAEEGDEELRALEGDYRGDFSSDTADIVFQFLVRIGKNYPLAVRNTLMRNLGYNHNPVKSLGDLKMREENQLLVIPAFEPRLKFPKGCLAPFCLIITLLSKYDQENKTAKEQMQTDLESTAQTIPKKCGDMIEALLLLQKFAGSPITATEFLKKIFTDENLPDKELPDKKVRKSLNWILRDVQTHKCFKIDEKMDNSWLDENLEPAWRWFKTQMRDPASLCGLLFRLVRMGVVKERNEMKQLEDLAIGPL